MGLREILVVMAMRRFRATASLPGSIPINMPPQQTPDQIVTSLVISPNGKFLFEVGTSVFRVYKVDPNTGVLTLSITDTATHLGGMV
jgi:hypothetical protein